jgi:hypothetical protein
MAIGTNEALSEIGLVQGKDYLTGGVDWSKEGLSAIKKGQISSSAGGHFMDAAWAVIMLYDHFNGFPFTAETLSQFQSPMSLISIKDIDFLIPNLESGEWDEINFSQRSKTLNKDMQEYNFSPRSVVDELRKTNKI